MRKLSKIKGYRDPQIKRFNEMYADLRENLAEHEEEDSNALLRYSQAEVDEFRSYLVLAEVDENKRREAMDHKRSVKDYSEEDISRFDQMQEVLKEFNKLLDDDDINIALVLPEYSDIEMIEHSQYRELWIADQCKD